MTFTTKIFLIIIYLTSVFFISCLIYKGIKNTELGREHEMEYSKKTIFLKHRNWKEWEKVDENK